MQYKYILPRDDKNTRSLAKGTITIVFLLNALLSHAG